MYSAIERILLKNLIVISIRDNTKGFILPSGEYLVVRNSHSDTVSQLGLTLKEVLDENILRFGSYDGIAYIEKSDLQKEFTVSQKSCLRDFIETNNIKKIQMDSKIYDLTDQDHREKFIKKISINKKL